MEDNVVSLSESAIDVNAILQYVSSPDSGAIDMFVGTVRNHSEGRTVLQLEYSAYIPMAERLMVEIEREVRGKWEVHKMAIVHRVGVLKVAEVAVVIAVSSSHRKDAFEACRYAIDRIKTVVPIWKKEEFAEGAVWVPGRHEVDINGTVP